MKELLTMAISCAIACCAFAQSGEATIAATLREDGSTNTWTQADLQDALGLMNRKYWRDMQTDAGRQAWHGKRMGQFILTNGTELVRVDVYVDGFIATNRAHAAARTVRDPEAAAKAKAEQQRRDAEARAAWERANLPPELAALREAQRQAAQTNTVTVNMEGN